MLGRVYRSGKVGKHSNGAGGFRVFRCGAVKESAVDTTRLSARIAPAGCDNHGLGKRNKAMRHLLALIATLFLSLILLPAGWAFSVNTENNGNNGKKMELTDQEMDAVSAAGPTEA